MANVQNEPMFDIASNLGAVLRAQFPVIKLAKMGWPDRKWLQVDGNLPAVFFVDLSETGRHWVSQFDTSSVVKNADGTRAIIREKLRLRTLVQISLFTNDKSQRDQLGWAIKQYLITNYHQPILDYMQATPVDTGEFLMLYYRGDHHELRGEAHFWQRDLTFDIQSRVLDSTPAFSIQQVQIQPALDDSISV